jgi:PGF-pre-PGF domain-containing protein
MKINTKVIAIFTLIILFGIVLQVQSSLAETDVTPEQFMGQIEGKIDVYSYPLIVQINEWARDTYFVQYFNKNTKHVIILHLNDDLSVSDVEFRQYGSPVGTIPDSVANDAVGKLRYKTKTESLSNGTVTFKDQKINISFNNEASGNVSLTEVINRPEVGAPIVIDIAVPGNLKDTSGNITFQVSQEWLNLLGITKEDVRLYNESMEEREEWEEVPTRYVRTIGKYEQYEATTILEGLVMIGPALSTETGSIINRTVVFKRAGIKEIVPKIDFDKATSGNVTINIYKALAGYKLIDFEVPESVKDTSGTITFQVSKEWINNSGIKKKDIRLFHGLSGGWDPLPTKYIGTSDEYERYEAGAPEFTLFMISNSPPKSSLGSLVVFVIVFTFDVFLVFIIVRKMRKNRANSKKQEEDTS